MGKTKNNTYAYDEPISFYTENDTLSVNKNYLYYNNEYDDLDNKELQFNANVEFYLDRAIYRPGQTVYYKGIAVQKLKGKVSVVPYTTFKIIVSDANQNDFKNLMSLQTNLDLFLENLLYPKLDLQELLTSKQTNQMTTKKTKLTIKIRTNIHFGTRLFSLTPL